MTLRLLKPEEHIGTSCAYCLTGRSRSLTCGMRLTWMLQKFSLFTLNWNCLKASMKGILSMSPTVPPNCKCAKGHKCYQQQTWQGFVWSNSYNTAIEVIWWSQTNKLFSLPRWHKLEVPHRHHQQGLWPVSQPIPGLHLWCVAPLERREKHHHCGLNFSIWQGGPFQTLTAVIYPAPSCPGSLPSSLCWWLTDRSCP